MIIIIQNHPKSKHSNLGWVLNSFVHFWAKFLETFCFFLSGLSVTELCRTFSVGFRTLLPVITTSWLLDEIILFRFDNLLAAGSWLLGISSSDDWSFSTWRISASRWELGSPVLEGSEITFSCWELSNDLTGVLSLLFLEGSEITFSWVTCWELEAQVFLDRTVLVGSETISSSVATCWELGLAEKQTI